MFAGVLLSVIIAAFGAVLIASGLKSESRSTSRLATLGVVVLVGHLIVGVVLLGVLGIDNSDAKEYHRNALLLAESWAGDASAAPRLLEGKSGWVYVVATGYFLGGPTPLISVAFNAVFLAAACVLVGRAARDFGLDERGQYVAASVVAFAPAYWIWGSQPLREASVAAALAATLFFTGRMVRGHILVGLGGLSLSLLGLYTVRGSLAFIVVGAAGLALVAGSASGRAAFGQRLVLVVAAIATLPLAQSTLASSASERSLDRITAVRSAQSTQASSGFETGGDIASNSGLVAATTSGLPRVAVGPLPWELRTVPPVLLTEALYFWAITVLALLGFRRVPSRSLRWFTVVALAGLYIALAVYSGNYGTMLRIRAMAYPYLAVAAAMGFARIRPTQTASEKPILGRQL